MRRVIHSLICTIILTGWVAAKERPNVLWIMVDDLNDWVGCLGGHPQARTPHIDALAEAGAHFRHAYCSAPGCNASRTSVMFGVSPETSGVYRNGDHWRRSEYLQDKESLPVFLRRNGYETLRGGKIFHAHTFVFHDHSVHDDPTYGSSQPEAWVRAFPSWIRQMPQEVRPENWPVETDQSMFYRGQLDWAPLNEELKEKRKMADTQVVDWALDELGKDRDKPFFMAVGIYRPHTPWYVPEEFFEAFPLEEIELPQTSPDDLADIPEAGRRHLRIKWHQWLVKQKKWKQAVRGYLASMAYADHEVGRLLAGLESSAYRENTIVILMSDHGYHLGEKQHWEKFTLWEDATHVPLVIKLPNRPKGQVRDEVVSLLDLYATVTELLELPTPSHVEGRSLSPLLLDGKEDGPPREAVTISGKGNRAVRSGQYRRIEYHDGSREVYDHDLDPHEWNNLHKN